MDDWRELRTIRDRQEQTRRALDRIAYRSPGVARMLVQVFQQTTIPTATGKYFACHEVDPGGPECEGCTPTFSANAGTLFVLVVGERVPEAGDYLIAEPIDGRWLADSGKEPGCSNLGPCPDGIPEVLSFQDTYFGHTMAAIWTPDNPAAPCGAGGWIAYYTLAYPGSALPCTLTCPPSTVVLRYTLRFSFPAGTPQMFLSFGQPVPFACPSGGTIPAGPWSAALGNWVLGSWSCTPTFSASFGQQFGSSLYECHVDPDVRILVTTPP